MEVKHVIIIGHIIPRGLNEGLKAAIDFYVIMEPVRHCYLFPLNRAVLESFVLLRIGNLGLSCLTRKKVASIY